ncbi:MAG TPA: phosphate ABC transporter substrate-binding protein [Saprospiraceae bacterium]|nr:phosphate ABC transporter substrate-binding protein [Saprospiraceae bacterium]
MAKLMWTGLLLLLFACTGRRVETLVIKGSDTEVNAVLQLAERYMELDSAVSISITGGGSGVGVAALLNGKIDLANSSRELNSHELQYAEHHGLRIVPHILAADALVIITHPSVGLDSLDMTQLAGLFAGDITDWQALGARPGPVSLYGRQSNSGTFMYFRDKVLGRDFSPALKQMNGTAQIIEAVRNDPGAIGYVGLGYAAEPDGSPRAGIRVLGIIPAGQVTAVSPLHRDNLTQGRYPLLRPLYQFSIGEASGRLRAFLDFEQSAEGRRIIEENGYLPVEKGTFVTKGVDEVDKRGL